ncbi:HTH_Tnp_Tc3_2 domain-containing protein [Trichonephila clavipes]|nr:HTH_Tnp_Tc3_2 domain-containing protein [Trichonephila clavipes]
MAKRWYQSALSWPYGYSRSLTVTSEKEGRARVSLPPRWRTDVPMFAHAKLLIICNTEWKFVVLSNGNGFYLGASDECVLVKKTPGERLQPNYLRPRYIGPTPGVMVWGAISYDGRSTVVVIPSTLPANSDLKKYCMKKTAGNHNAVDRGLRGVFQKRNAPPHITVVTQCALQSDLRDLKICLQLSTYGISLNDNTRIIHNQH